MKMLESGTLPLSAPQCTVPAALLPQAQPARQGINQQ
jgi:hypothetical protein